MDDKLQTPPASDQTGTQDAAQDFAPATGFLPIETNWFDRLFISVVIWIALSLCWFRFIEPMGLSIWISNVIALALAVIIIRKG